MMKYLSYGLFIFLLLTSCKKNKDKVIEIQGRVTNSADGSGAEGVTVKILYQEVSNGTFSNYFQQAAASVTDANGNYRLSFEKPNALNYKFELSSSQFFGEEEMQDPSALSVSETNTKDFSVAPIGYFSIRIRNNPPFSSSDSITYQNISESYGCSSCCNNQIRYFTGTSVDTTFVCKRVGGSRIRFNWFVTIMSNTYNYSDSVFCPPLDTAFYTINY